MWGRLVTCGRLFIGLPLAPDSVIGPEGDDTPQCGHGVKECLNRPQKADCQSAGPREYPYQPAPHRLGFLLIFALLANRAWAQLPDGPGKVETDRLCSQCHELARSISLRQDRAGWATTVDKMVGFGAKGTDKEITAVIDYLSIHFGAEEMPRLNVNKARAIDFESGLNLKRSQAATIIEYRTKNGPFHSIDDLKKVPGIEAAKIDAKKDRLTFDDKP